MATATIRVKWDRATVFDAKRCKLCFNKKGDGREVPCFGLELCAGENTYPVTRVPQWRTKIRHMVIAHYKQTHPEWVIY